MNIRFISSRRGVPLSRPYRALTTPFWCNPVPMDGVKPISVGPDSFGGCRALVGCAVRIQSQPQPAVPFHNRSRLGRRGSRFAVESVECQSLVASGDPYVHPFVAGRILDRTVIFSTAKAQSPVHIGNVCPAVGCNICKRVEPKYKKLFHEKRGT